MLLPSPVVAVGREQECPNFSHKAKTEETGSSGTVHINIPTAGWAWGAIHPGRFISVVFLFMGLVGSLGFSPPVINPEIKWPSFG